MKSCKPAIFIVFSIGETIHFCPIFIASDSRSGVHHWDDLRGDIQSRKAAKHRRNLVHGRKLRQLLETEWLLLRRRFDQFKRINLDGFHQPEWIEG